VICPNQIYYIGYQFGVAQCCVDGDYPLVSRANTHFKCGTDGSRANNCTLYAGSTHVVYNEFIFDEELTGVIVEGFTFDSPQLMTSVLIGSGDITFVDCLVKVRSTFLLVVANVLVVSAVFVDSLIRSLPTSHNVQNQKNAGPFVAAYEPNFGGRRLTQEDKDIMGQTPSERLGYVTSDAYLKSLPLGAHPRRSKGVAREPRELQTVLQVISMERCIFMNCSQGDYGDLLPTYGVISSLTSYNAFIFSDCIFSDNVYDGVRCVNYVMSASCDG
jgi:hypothetical protein